MKLGTIEVRYLSSYNIGAKTKKPTHVYSFIIEVRGQKGLVVNSCL